MRVNEAGMWRERMRSYPERERLNAQKSAEAIVPESGMSEKGRAETFKENASLGVHLV
jgi:hypothetical protein